MSKHAEREDLEETHHKVPAELSGGFPEEVELWMTSGTAWQNPTDRAMLCSVAPWEGAPMPGS